MIPDRLVRAFLDAKDVAAGDMAELVRDHALQLVHILGRGEQARVDVDDLPAGDEGVDLPVADQHDPDILGLKPGRDDQRPGDFAQEGLGFGIAQDLLGPGRLRPGEERQRHEHEQTDEQGRPPLDGGSISHRILSPRQSLNPG